MNPTKPRRPHRRPTSKDKHRCKPCNKVTFPNRGAAYAAALRLSRHVGPVRAYHCPHGTGWHLTRLREWIGR